MQKVQSLRFKVQSLLLAGLAGIVAFAGCASNPDLSHIRRAVGTGTKVGITQNPGTGAYELGVSRVQIEYTSIPVVFSTNSANQLQAVIPDVVSRYEVATHSAIFGNAGLTSTLATGTNAVNTAVGGSTPPINNGVGTGSNLPNAAK